METLRYRCARPGSTRPLFSWRVIPFFVARYSRNSSGDDDIDIVLNQDRSRSVAYAVSYDIGDLRCDQWW
jgi:hypothetical protein